MTLESKDIRFRKAEFVAKTQFLFAVEFFIYPCCMAGILGISQPQSKKPQIISSRSADFSNISQPQSTKQQLISSHSACTSSISQPQCTKQWLISSRRLVFLTYPSRNVRNKSLFLATALVFLSYPTQVQKSQAYPCHSAEIPSISQPKCRTSKHILAAVQISQAYPSHSAGIPSIFASRGCLANSSHCSWILIASHTLKRTNQNLTL